MKRESIDAFEKVNARMMSAYQEISALSKKSPNDALNKFKLGLINEIIRDYARVLGDAYLPLGSFVEFSDADLPSNSDVAFVASQYLEAGEKFRSDHIEIRGGSYCWKVDEPEVKLRTSPPKKLGR